MKSYIPNNINFRIVSSTSIAKFKQDQAYDFNEIIKQRDVITAPAREVILLEYDHWFKWIVKLEKVFLLLNEEDKNDTLIQKTDVLLRNEMDDILVEIDLDDLGVKTYDRIFGHLQITNIQRDQDAIGRDGWPDIHQDVGSGGCQHFIGHVKTVGFAGRANAARRQNHIQTGAAAKVQDNFARVKRAEGGWVTATKRSLNQFL